MAVLHGDRGGVVLGWLIKLVVTLAVVGVLLFDAASMARGAFQVDDHAQQAARAAMQDFEQGKDVQRAYDAAVTEVLADGDTVEASTFSVDTDGGVSLTLTREVPTMLMEKVPPLRRFTTLTRTVFVARPS